ncbi:hypothetical protein HD554DRAFT_2011749 [Boletus coccyginus]|nr:hypothetical protein HD554DRAFT_2011749 [Boletus coccyginus]
MSHNQSPGPSALLGSQMFVPPASVTPSMRQKNKAYATGIAAGVEDEKYQAKYKELKRKVKEIEMDNDKLQFKVLMAKKSIQRMKLERAVLYERLSAVPPSPDVHGHASLPPLHAGPGVPPQHPQQKPGSGQHRDPRSMDISDSNTPDYIHPSGNIRVISGPDGRPVQVSDGPIGPGVAPSHAVSSAHMSRRGSASGHDSRQLPPLSQLTPVQHLEHPRSHAQSQPHTHLHSHSNGSDSHSRPHSSSHSRGQGPPHGYHQGVIPYPQQYPPESVPSGQAIQSPPLERERSRRYDTHERSSHSGDPYPHGRHQMAHASPHSTIMSPTSARGSTTRVHNHQRVGPGTSINHPDFEHERDIERERNWSRQREHDYDREAPRDYTNSALVRNSPPPHLRSRLERDYQDHPSYRLREDQTYLCEPIGPGVYGRSSRSDTPGSGSGSAEAQPRSDAHAQYYDRERPRPYAPPRGINQLQASNDDIDFVHDDGRLHNRDRDRGTSYMPPEQYRPPLESSRKRSRNDMDIDGEDDVVSPPGDSSGGGDSSLRYGGSLRTDDRGSKRLHQEGIPSSAQGYGGHDEPEEGHSGD